MPDLFVSALIYLAAALVMVPLAHRLGLSSVLGYLVAGVLIGPQVFSFIQDEAAVMRFAEFGVVMMLFLIGLQIQPTVLWRERRRVLGLGTWQLVLSTVALSALFLAFGMPWREALALGLILPTSSTAIVLQTLTERGLLRSKGGEASFFVLLFQDLSVIPILALLPLLAITAGAPDAAATPGRLGELPAWAEPLLMIGVIVGVIVVGRTLLRPAFRIIANTRQREVFTAFALFIVIGVAVLMTLVGLSAALGAFLGGALLADNEYRHELESDVEPFKGLLLGLFFISVGASLNLQLLAQQPALVFGGVAAIMLVKGLVLALIGPWFGLQREHNLLFGIGLSQIGEYAFLFLGFARQEGVLPPAQVDLFLAISIVSLAVTPLTFLAYYRLAPRFRAPGAALAPDAISERNRVIIAGFGRFGHIVGRLLSAHRIPTTVLDSDPEHVEVLRRLGMKVFYGDATRLDLLTSAGAAEAHLFVAALDNPAQNLHLVEQLRRNFPKLKILARAHGRDAAYELLEAGADEVYRETLDSALALGTDALRHSGVRGFRALRTARIFRRFDELTLRQLAKLRHDEDNYMSQARLNISELEEILLRDREVASTAGEEAWTQGPPRSSTTTAASLPPATKNPPPK